MKMPFMVVSYGDFTKTKKLFSYDRNGVHILPLFTDVAKAHSFISAMNEALGESLIMQLCSDVEKAYQMFGAISVYADIQLVTINPIAPIRNDDLTIPTKFSLIEETKQLDEIMNELHDQLKSRAVSKA